MAADELTAIRSEMQQLRQIIADMHKMGRVAKVEKGRILIDYGKGDVGDNGKTLNGTWIRTSHGGAVSSGEQWAVGETVHVYASGGNAEHADVRRAGFNDEHPIDGNDKKDNTTRRWRKPPENDNDQSQSEGGSQYENGKPRQTKWKDDEKDHQEIYTHDKRKFKFKDFDFEATDDGMIVKHKDYNLKLGKEGFEANDDKSKITLKDGIVTAGDKTANIEIKEGKIKVNGEIMDGKGRKFAVEGTKTSTGDTLASQFANE